MKVEIHFANEKLLKSFERLKSSSENQLYKWLRRAFDDIKQSPFCGVQVRKKLIPKEYIKKYNVRNLWKYNLPNAWRLIYSIEASQVVIISIILEWLNHKEYERRFKY